MPEGEDPEAVAPKKKKKKKALNFESLQQHGYEAPPPIEESETYKRIQTVSRSALSTRCWMMRGYVCRIA